MRGAVGHPGRAFRGMSRGHAAGTTVPCPAAGQSKARQVTQSTGSHADKNRNREEE